MTQVAKKNRGRAQKSRGTPSDPKDTALRRVRRYSGNGVEGEVLHADALQLLRALPDETADIVFLDPPFNLGKRYSKSQPSLDRKPELEYSRWLDEILAASARVLAPGGALYLYHLPVWAMRATAKLEALQLDFRHWIAVSMKNGFARGQRLYPAHYALLFFTKGDPKRFKRPKMPAPKCRHCGKYVKDYGGYRRIIDAQGLNLTDFWEDLSPVRHANRKHRAANELPRQIFDRVVAISGGPGALYVDPFAGSGTGALAATAKGLRFSICDLVRANCEIACRRIDEMAAQQESLHAPVR